MTPDQIKLAHRRLQLGITNVGSWVLTASTGLYWLADHGAPAVDVWRLAVIAIGAVAVQAVFDFIGGTLLMPEPQPSLTGFLRSWARGVIVHTLVLASVGLLSYASFRLSGGFCLAILLATCGLAFGRRHLLRAIGGSSTTSIALEGDAILMVAATDLALTGGIVGFGRRARSVVPASWLDSVPRGEFAAESSRRRWQIDNGLPARTFVVILSWNLLGAYVGSLAFGLADRTPLDALLGHACWMTLFTFGGLLVLPALSRNVVFAADRAAADVGTDPRSWISRFPGLVGEDGSPRAAVETVFYPIPSAARRLRQLEKPSPRFVPGSLARSNLYYSWATLTLLGRAVHCNVGRPVLWVFPPSA